jgi:hypothetical protein
MNDDIRFLERRCCVESSELNSVIFYTCPGCTPSTGNHDYAFPGQKPVAIESKDNFVTQNYYTEA